MRSVARALGDALTRSRGQLSFCLLAVACVVVSIWLTAPGFMSADSGAQLLQARTLALSDAHPPLVALLWRLCDRLIEGPVGLLIFNTSLHWLGMSALFWGLAGSLGVRGAGLVLVGFFPPLFANVPALWKDTVMQCALTAAIACLVVPASRIPRKLTLSVALLLCVLGIGARHNAAAAVFPLLVLPCFEVSWLKRFRPWKRLLLAATLAFILTASLSVGLGRVMAPLAKAEKFWQTIPTFDLAAMSLDTGQMLIEPESRVLTPGMGLTELKQLFRPEYNASLYYCVRGQGSGCIPLLRRTLDDERLAALAANWRHAIVQHPAAYLHHRFRFSLALVGLEGGPTQSYYLSGAPHHPLAKEYPLGPRAVALLAWIDAHLLGLWFRPWLYVLIGLLVLPMAAVRCLRSQSARVALALACSGLGYLLSSAIAAGTTDYRYTVWTTFCSVLAAIILVNGMLVARPEISGRR